MHGTTLLHGGTCGTGPGQYAPPAQAHSPLAGPLTAGLDLVHLLGTRIPTLRRVPIAASSTCARALTCLLQAMEQKKTCDTLARLLLVPRIALAAPRTGWQGNEVLFDPAMSTQLPSSGYGPIGELITRINRQAAINGPRTRAQSRAVATETTAASPQASNRTAAAFRALLAEGSPGRALQLLTSDGVCDAADPAVPTRLRELHPQAEGPKPRAPVAKGPL